jgi:hypothetical protein
MNTIPFCDLFMYIISFLGFLFMSWNRFGGYCTGKAAEAPPRIRNASQRCPTFEEREPFFHSFHVKNSKRVSLDDLERSSEPHWQLGACCRPLAGIAMFNVQSLRCDVHNMAEQIRITVLQPLIHGGCPHLCATCRQPWPSSKRPAYQEHSRARNCH